MKKISFILLAFFFLFSCGNEIITDNNISNIIDMENPPKIEFDETNFNFGTVIEGEKITHKFTFTNTGKGALLISAVNADCNCTIAQNWSKNPINKGEKGFIDVTFNTEGKIGENTKNITITANTKPTDTRIQMIGTVVGPTGLEIDILKNNTIK